LVHLGEEGIRRVDPISQEGHIAFERAKEQSAFEKWGEGLEWGIPQPKTKPSDECSGDLILP